MDVDADYGSHANKASGPTENLEQPPLKYVLGDIILRELPLKLLNNVQRRLILRGAPGEVAQPVFVLWAETIIWIAG